MPLAQHLERDLPLHWLVLASEVDGAEAALAEHPQDFERADVLAGGSSIVEFGA